ncbi:MAG: hypothetical protein N3C59_02030 [Azovibrio sp.]|nr:hypothetical protein [Azovibrio sp.]
MKDAAMLERAGISARGQDMRQAGLSGFIEVPASEIEFVERAYRASLIWLGCTLLGTASFLGVGLMG